MRWIIIATPLNLMMDNTLTMALVRHPLDYWKEIFDHWVETRLSLKDFCVTRQYEMVRVYTAFYDKLYVDFMRHQAFLAGRVKEVKVIYGRDGSVKLDDWEVQGPLPQCRLNGIALFHPKFPPSSRITSTLVIGKRHEVVVTECGTVFQLIEPSARFEVMYPNARARFLALLKELPNAHLMVTTASDKT